MAIRYDRYDRLASRAVDRLYGEPSTILPMTAAAANGRAGRDSFAASRTRRRASSIARPPTRRCSSGTAGPAGATISTPFPMA